MAQNDNGGKAAPDQRNEAQDPARAGEGFDHRDGDFGTRDGRPPGGEVGGDKVQADARRDRLAAGNPATQVPPEPAK